MYTTTGTEMGLEWDHNLVILVRVSYSLQNSDYTPSGFYISNPSNTYTNNRVAGSEGHGFWYDLYTAAVGGTSGSISPYNIPLTSFENNGAHTNLRHGLFITKYDPR